MNWLWTSSDLLAAMNGRPVGNLPEGITGISIDSRTIGDGEAFFAIRGDRVDGHDYAGIALANGAALLVVSEAKLPALGRLIAPMIVVDDVLEAMIRLGCAARDRSAAKIIAVTGSVGKTTTKEMLRHVLSPLGRVHASVASFNNHWGVPLTLARMPETTDFGVFEIGMNHAGEILPLTRMVRPHVAVVTSIAAAHLGNFTSLDEMRRPRRNLRRRGQWRSCGHQSGQRAIRSPRKGGCRGRGEPCPFLRRKSEIGIPSGRVRRRSGRLGALGRHRRQNA